MRLPLTVMSYSESQSHLETETRQQTRRVKLPMSMFEVPLPQSQFAVVMVKPLFRFGVKLASTYALLWPALEEGNWIQAGVRSSSV